jgi:SlyX protein
MEERLTRAEEQIAHLTRIIDDLSDVVARQQADIALQTKRIEMLVAREAERALDAGGGATLTDQRPPHW